ncbi:E3 ubiquitin-protein ligase TRIM71-like [Mytilus californianus]|uniref:E3 ubiquitin-protein ligase TRIM71-like n=1 Tax=Mytilus californianus TaxID=6549 RepID=UPI002246B8FF|nr:E3 ubiquitin-protein ligase TRIM71-like [Mytilus californianus]
MEESLIKEETPLCDVCVRDKCTEFAEFWCRECVENLCTPCAVVHQKLKITSEHYVLPLYIKMIISAQILDIPVTCSKHSNQSVLFYCSEHKSVLCNLCKKEHHKQCRELEEIKDKTDSDSFIGHFKNKAEQVKGSLDQRIEEKTKNKNLMQAEHNSILVHDEIGHFCQEIKNKIDALQSGLVENLSHHHSKRIEKVDDNIETFLKIQSSVKSIEHDIKNVRDHLTKKQHFVILVALEHELQRKMNALSRLPTDEDRIQLRFQRSNLLDLITDLGTISSTHVSTSLMSNQIRSVGLIAHEDRRLQNEENLATNIIPESEVSLMRDTAFSQTRVETGLRDLNDKLDTDCQSDSNETILYHKESLDFQLDTDNKPGLFIFLVFPHIRLALNVLPMDIPLKALQMDIH